MEGTRAHDAWTGLSPEERVRACLEMISDGTTATSEDIQGLGEDAIRQIDEDQPAALGDAYRCFLRGAGAGAGRFLQGSDVFHPEVLGLRAAAEELLAGTGIALEATDRVILMHQGFQFDFLRGNGEDPEVWSYCDGSTPQRNHTHFTEWLRANAEEQTSAWARLTPWRT